MHLILSTPNAPPGSPHCAQIVEIALRCSDHVKGVPVFMGASAGWCYWIMCLPSEESSIKASLLFMTSERRSYPGLDPSTSGEIDKALCRWLEIWNKDIE